MIRFNLDTAKSLSLAALAPAYTLVMLAALSGTNGAMVGQLIV